METHRTGGTAIPVQHGGAPVTTTHTTTSAAPSRGGRSEGKEGEQLLEAVKQKGEQVYHAACDACHNWRHYPKILTTVLLLSSFLLGAGTLGLVSKTGIMGGGHYLASHWDRETADAHHALDVVLDHLKHPELYETSKHGKSILARSRDSIGDFLSGFAPKSWKTGRRGIDTEDVMDRVGMRGGSKYGYGGRGGKGITEEMYDKMSDITGDMQHGMKYGAEQVKDVGYGLGHKMSEMADAVKSKLSFGGGDSEDYIERGKESVKRGVGMDDRRRYRDEDDLDVATQKIRRVARQAEREL